ncbi:MAG TPA: hypothetical protein VGV35_15990, partial [Bryobacteraceae bacterium]|nr:hypothetical protein [Bryobacteraceae bacterium]
MPSRIVERILAQTGVPRLFSVLAEDLPLSDLQSLLLEVYQARSAALRERDVVARAQPGLMAPSKVEARLLHKFDGVAFDVASGFEAIELSPVGPLGLNRVLGDVGQNSVLTTIRNAEVLGDATMALALECSWRRKAEGRSGAAVQLCSSHRMVRMQPFDVPGYVPHFRLFSMVSAGRDTGSHAFEVERLGEHVGFYLRLFQALNERGFRFGSPLVEISDPAITVALLESQGISLDEVRREIRAHRVGGSDRFLAERGVTFPDAAEIIAEHRRLALLQSRLVEVLRAFPDAQLRFNFARLEGLAYYSGATLRISPAAPDGQRYP